MNWFYYPRANTSPVIFLAPLCLRTFAHSFRVAPVVAMSSTRIISRPLIAVGSVIENLFPKFSSRASLSVISAWGLEADIFFKIFDLNSSWIADAKNSAIISD